MKVKDHYGPMSLSNKCLVIALFSAVLGLAGCEQEGPAEQTGKKIDEAAEAAGDRMEDTKESLGESAERAGEYLSDSAITTKIKAEILSDPLLKTSQIDVTTTNGVVTLTGVVDSQQSIDRTLEIVRSNPNVKSVENSLVAKGTR